MVHGRGETVRSQKLLHCRPPTNKRSQFASRRLVLLSRSPEDLTEFPRGFRPIRTIDCLGILQGLGTSHFYLRRNQICHGSSLIRISSALPVVIHPATHQMRHRRLSPGVSLPLAALFVYLSPQGQD